VDRAVQPMAGTEQVFEPGKTSDIIYKSDHLQNRIRRLLIESADAREKGHWKKAQGLLFELRKMTRL
jgi:hypothetical protein